jgi:nucleoside-diphosphate-sugar epimerase
VPAPIHDPARLGDIIHSQADISKIRERLGFEPDVCVKEGIEHLVRWSAERIHSSAR